MTVLKNENLQPCQDDSTIRKKQIGIIGGMGPLATCDMLQKIVALTKAKCDQDYPRVFVDSNTNIPDRTEAILNNGKCPTPYLIESARILQDAGADFLIMPCNTAHYFLPQVRNKIDIPILDMPRKTVERLSQEGIQKVGLLATSGTLSANIYHPLFKANGIQVLTPDSREQKVVMSMIYTCIKGERVDYDPVPFFKVVTKLFSQGAQTMVLACTELPIAWKRFDIDGAYMDPTETIVKHAILQAGYEIIGDNKYPPA